MIAWPVYVLMLGALVNVPGSRPPARSRLALVFLTRDGCANTPIIRVHLNDALRALGLPRDYQTVNIGTLPRTDP